MIRQTTLAWILGAAFLSSAIYAIKHEVRSLETKLKTVNAEIVRSREAMHVLAAEWTHLNQPMRIDRLGRELLQLRPLSGAQVMRMSDLLTESPSSAPAEFEKLPPQVVDSSPSVAVPTVVDESTAAMIDRFKRK
jgi:hypothetical protein